MAFRFTIADKDSEVAKATQGREQTIESNEPQNPQGRARNLESPSDIAINQTKLGITYEQS